MQSSESGIELPRRPLAPTALPAIVPARAPVVRAPALSRVVIAAGFAARLLLLSCGSLARMDRIRAPEVRVQRILRGVAALTDSTCTAMLATANQCKPLNIATSKPRLLSSISQSLASRAWLCSCTGSAGGVCCWSECNVGEVVVACGKGVFSDISAQL